MGTSQVKTPPAVAAAEGARADLSTQNTDNGNSQSVSRAAGSRQFGELDHLLVDRAARDAMIGESMALAIVATVAQGGDVAALVERQLPEWRLVAKRQASAVRQLRHRPEADR